MKHPIKRLSGDGSVEIVSFEPANSSFPALVLLAIAFGFSVKESVRKIDKDASCAHAYKTFTSIMKSINH